MKNNFMKSITLFSLLILVSCNSVSYKYDEPLFISGDKASESVKENLFEKTKKYANFIPDGCYEYDFVRTVKYDDEYVDEIFHNVKIKIRNIISPLTGKLSYTCDKVIWHFKSAENANWYSPKFHGVYKETIKMYDGNTYIENTTAFNESYSFKHYYSNLKDPVVKFSFLFNATNILSLDKYYDLYSKDNIFHFEYNNTSRMEPKENNYYFEDVAFKYNSDFTKLYNISYIFFSYGDYFYDSNGNPNKDYTTLKLKSIDDFKVEMPSLDGYTLQDNSNFVSI